MLYRFNPAKETIIDSGRFSHSAIDGSYINILNWNIAKNNHTQEWHREFTDIFLQYRPDLIFFQEARIDPRTNQSIKLKEMGWNFAPNFIDSYKDHYFGVLTASKAKHARRKSLLTQAHEPLLKTPKVALITEYHLLQSKQTLATVNCHGINFVNTHRFKTQLHQIERWLSRHKGPIILSGDFNTWNSSRMNLLRAMSARLNLKQVDFSSSDRQQLKRFLFSDPLDHIFYRGLQEKPRSARVLADISSSDHNPMVVEFFIPE